MQHGVSLAQRRTFEAAVDEGSISAAGGRFGRPNPRSASRGGAPEATRRAVFARAGRYPRLMPVGSALFSRRASGGEGNAIQYRVSGMPYTDAALPRP